MLELSTRLALLAPLTITLSGGAWAQELWATRSLPARLDAHSSVDGSLLAAGSIDLDALVGFAGASQFVWDVERGTGGEIWVSNYTAQQIHRLSQDGTAYLGDLPINVGRSVGIAVEGNHLWVASVGGNAAGGLYVFDRTTWAQLLHVPATNIWDVHASQGRVLISRSTGVVEEVQLSTGAVLPFAGPGGFCEQISDRVGSGFVVANFTGSGYWEIDGIGMTVATYSGLGIGSVRGVASLANGTVLLNSTTGAHTYDFVTGTAVQITTGGGCFIGRSAGTTLVSSSNCSSNPNSTGAVALISGSGSNQVSANDVFLTASSMPQNAFGFFLVSRTPGQVMNPGGSQGILCLSGSIGRYVGPGQIQNSGAQGSIGLQLNLTSIPQPAGAVAAAPGDTWHFQAWFRDSVGGTPTSNFTSSLTVPFQ